MRFGSFVIATVAITLAASPSVIAQSSGGSDLTPTPGASVECPPSGGAAASASTEASPGPRPTEMAGKGSAGSGDPTVTRGPKIGATLGQPGADRPSIESGQQSAGASGAASESQTHQSVGGASAPRC